MGAFTNLWNSEKGLAGGLLIIAATVLTALGHMTIDAWVDYTKWIFGIFVAGKTAQGVAALIAGKPEAAEESKTVSVTVKDVVKGEIEAKS